MAVALHALQECTMSTSLMLGPLTMVRQVILLTFLPIRPHQQLTFHRQFCKKKLMLPSQHLLEYSTVMLFRTVLHIECMAQMVWQNCPGIVNMVQLSWTLFHETVTVRHMKRLESKLTLLKYTS